MKNSSIYQRVLFLLTFNFIVAWCFGQSQALVGKVVNSAGVITNAADAAKALGGGLTATATVSDLRIVWVGGDENKFYLIGHVSGDKVSAKGITLAEESGLLYARSGPGLEITCSGKNCSRCDLVIRNWKLQCTCDTPGAGPEPPQCDYFARLIIAPW